MPKLKPTEAEKQNKQLLANINRQRRLYDVSVDDLAIGARVTDRAIYNRIKDPDSFSLKELRGIARKLHTTVGGLLGEVPL